jgi:hypothetical protein
MNSEPLWHKILVLGVILLITVTVPEFLFMHDFLQNNNYKNAIEMAVIIIVGVQLISIASRQL